MLQQIFPTRLRRGVTLIPGTFLDGLLGVVLLVVAQPPQPAPFLGLCFRLGHNDHNRDGCRTVHSVFHWEGKIDS